jgi:hypothetical protein
MTAKCPCQSCGVNIEFDVEAVASLVACPACGKNTRLTLPPARPAPPKETFIQRESSLWAASAAAKPEPVETKLDILGNCFFFGGVLLAGVAGIFLMIAIADDQPGKLQLVLLIVGAIGQGIIARILFQAGAEVVRLLRKTSQKP